MRTIEGSESQASDSLQGSRRGEMAQRFAQFDWSRTPLGPPETWPESWRNAVRIILDSSFPTAVALGPQLVYFYNDAFIPIGGPARHPSAIGKVVPEVWKEIWDDILRPRFDHTLRTGEPTGEEDLLMPLMRSGYLEETYITFSFAVLRGDDEQPNGIFCTAIENTARVIADRRLRCLRALAAQSSFAETPEAACLSAAATLEGHPRDLPFALLYLLSADGKVAKLAGHCGLKSLPTAVEESVDLTGPECPWKLSTVVQSGRPALVENVDTLIGGALHTADLTPRVAITMPIMAPGEDKLAGFLIAGANPMRPLAESNAFHELIANHLETAISNARAKQHVQERARALAEIDRAKTVFFSNISHELRTPLTLLLAPIDEILERNNLSDADRVLLDVARRSGKRLLKLVNTLLEFSRIEAGRVEASYEPTDLAAMTTDLVSVFRSAFERAGVELHIDCPPLGESIYVDRDMWEKIVLNLVSNAFKFTHQGSVRVRQHLRGQQVQLDVIDTGCGISPEDLPRLFERFFRGRATQSRTHEGTGIGLSLVQELVKLHGGTIEATSELGKGTTLTVRIPRGCAHLPPERIGAALRLTPTRIGATPFVEEALGWLPDAAIRTSPQPEQQPQPEPQKEPTTKYADARLLIVDDNTDMRGYLEHLLGARWRVETAADGIAALAHVRRHPPDLVIADVMMPGMDGFELLKRLREDPATAEIPVMLLSARAGEEASAEGLRAGADDYVIKPFSARELLARVESRLTQARSRAAERRAREAAEWANRARDEFFTTLSHELRTPLTAVLAWASLLRDKMLDPADIESAVDIIERNARIQRRLIDDLLDVSQIITGHLRIDPRTLTSLSPVVEAVVDSFRPVAQAKRLTINTHLAAHAGPVYVDPERLQQVVWNLLSNAMKFTQASGTVTIECRRAEEAVELRVTDTGRGIAPSALPHLFERHWQGWHTEHRPQGLGLGLSIAHRIVDLHGGRISAASPGEGLGATFTVRLPLSQHALETTGESVSYVVSRRVKDAALAAAELDVETHEEPAPPVHLSTQTPGILLVEDHEGIGRAFARLLVSHGYHVIRARSVAQAIEAAAKQRIGVLICDLHLPDGSGIELLHRIRSLLLHTGAGERLPAIAISGHVYESEISECLAAGFAIHLAKPFDASSLLAAIRQVQAAAEA